MKNYLKLIIVAVLVILASLLGSLVLQNFLNFGFQKIFHRLASVLGVISIIFYIFFIQKKSPLQYGFSLHDGWLKNLSIGAITGFVFISTITLIEIVLGVLNLNAAGIKTHIFNILFINVFSCAVIGIVEEFSFRGFLLQNLMDDFPTSAAVAFTSMIYAGVHFVKSLSTPEIAIMKFVGLFLLGVLLSVAYLKTKSLYLPIGIHASLVYFLKLNKSLFYQAKSLPEWIFGDKIMVGGIVSWAALFIGIMIIKRVNLWKKT